MAKFEVKVEYSFQKTLDIYASDEAEAEEKAVDIVLGWKNVHDAEVKEVERVE